MCISLEYISMYIMLAEEFEERLDGCPPDVGRD